MARLHVISCTCTAAVGWHAKPIRSLWPCAARFPTPSAPDARELTSLGDESTRAEECSRATWRPGDAMQRPYMRGVGVYRWSIYRDCARRHHLGHASTPHGGARSSKCCPDLARMPLDHGAGITEITVIQTVIHLTFNMRHRFHRSGST